ncbi:chemotaxis protein MotB [Marinicauda algicola]|uniref:Chemotaxis protein MotB n=2 Tax=Marinicauda algicola TaxID=2029849 RepID=A0A4S2GXI0_9PROT|nr:flagellar motor protein MotB [Marinicauda algicola]TGY87847.1 chemotaxis protein MotB [Marinicauda algicola]
MASDQPVIIKKVKKGGHHAHHGGAWKVAYADFVTAMMAFFLLMWLIATADPEQKRGIADYFAPASVSPSTSGSGGLLAGTDFGDEGVRGPGSASVVERLAPEAVRNENVREQESSEAADGSDGRPDVSQDALANALARREAAEFESAEMSLRQALQEMPELSELSRHIIVDETPEGLRIQLIDEEGRSMFEPGAVEPNERAVVLLRAVAEVAARLPNRLSISGHTDASPASASGPSNWELSAARANAALEVITRSGIAEHRIAEVSGKAGSEPLFPDDPFLAGNRRLSIILLREAPVIPPGHSL